MNIIIALRGKGNSGKSETIRILHYLLLQNAFELIRSTIERGYNDFISIFRKKNKLIGITSSGDTYDVVYDKLQEIINEGSEICICACRTFDRIPPGTNAAILEFENYHNQFIEKTINDNKLTQRNTNNSDAQKLYRSIESHLS